MKKIDVRVIRMVLWVVFGCYVALVVNEFVVGVVIILCSIMLSFLALIETDLEYREKEATRK